MENHLPSKYDPNIYYWYYGTQVMHHFGGEPWERWNNAMREALVELQDARDTKQEAGRRRGNPWRARRQRRRPDLHYRAGRCTLEVYYRHLPIYRSIEIESEE